MKAVASDKVEVIFITIIFAITDPTISYRGLITLKFIIEVSLSLNLTAELCGSRLSFLIWRAEGGLLKKKIIVIASRVSRRRFDTL